MKVTEIRLSRKFNLGNYESFEVSATAELDFGESFDEASRCLDVLLLSKKPMSQQAQRNGYEKPSTNGGAR